jgi:hypothetical protein
VNALKQLVSAEESAAGRSGIPAPAPMGAETVLDELIEHVRLLRGSHQLDDDFSIIEARFDHDTSKKAQ